MTDFENQLIMDYIINDNNIGNADVFDAIATFLKLDGNEIIDVIIHNENNLQNITTNSIPQFSNEKDIYIILKVLIDSGIKDFTYEQLGTYLCPNNAKPTAKRKYGENHYKFANQLGLTVKDHPFSATEIGVAYYLMSNNIERQSLLNRLVFSIPIVQHSIIKASQSQFSMPAYLSEFLSPSTAKRRRSNLHKIMSWAYEITNGGYKSKFIPFVYML